MNLSNINVNQRAIVKKMLCNEDLKKRFYSFGITKSAIIEVEEISLAKNTMEINVDDTSVAIRLTEADLIEVEVI